MPDTNYITDRNPFSLAKPPSWWLRGLHAFDHDLVILPSRRKMLFVVARRRRLSRSLGAAVDRKLALADPDHTFDSALCDTYGLIYVTSLLCTGGWTEANLQIMLDALDRRDTWKHGGPLDDDAQRKALFEGGSRLAKQLDQQDEDARQHINRAVRDDLYQATGDAWRSRQARRGELVLNAGRPAQPSGLIATPKPMPVRRLTGV
jgi:hypothetical protein